IKNKLYSKKNTYLSVVWAVFHLRGPASALVGCCGPSWAFVDKLYIQKKYIKKQTYLWPKRRVWRRLGPFPSLWASFSLFVGLRWLLWAFVGLHGCRPRQRGGVVGVVQPAKLYSKKKTQPPAYVTWRVARVGLLTQVCTGRGYCQAYPHPYPPVPVPVTLGVWPDPCLSLVVLTWDGPMWHCTRRCWHRALTPGNNLLCSSLLEKMGGRGGGLT